MHDFNGIPFFEGIDASDAHNYARHCVWKRYAEGEIVLDFDDLSADVFFILSGTVRIMIRTAAGREMIFGDIGAGRFFGEMAAIDATKRSANVTALTKAELCVVPAPVFRAIILGHPAMCEKLLKLLTSRVRELNSRLFERSILDLRHRLYAELLRLATPRKGIAGQSIISPPPIQSDLAARIGCRREQVSREISVMIDEKLAEKTKGALVLLKPAQLDKLVRGAIDKAD